MQKAGRQCIIKVRVNLRQARFPNTMLRSFILMLGFFTRIPVPQIEYTEERYIRGIPLLPFVGAVSGALLLLVFQLSRWLPMPVTALAVFLAYLLITGGIHLDGGRRSGRIRYARQHLPGCL